MGRAEGRTASAGSRWPSPRAGPLLGRPEADARPGRQGEASTRTRRRHLPAESMGPISDVKMRVTGG